jgi:hypothetical protein
VEIARTCCYPPAHGVIRFESLMGISVITPRGRSCVRCLHASACVGFPFGSAS